MDTCELSVDGFWKTVPTGSRRDAQKFEFIRFRFDYFLQKANSDQDQELHIFLNNTNGIAEFPACRKPPPPENTRESGMRASAPGLRVPRDRHARIGRQQPPRGVQAPGRLGLEARTARLERTARR